MRQVFFKCNRVNVRESANSGENNCKISSRKFQLLKANYNQIFHPFAIETLKKLIYLICIRYTKNIRLFGHSASTILLCQANETHKLRNFMLITRHWLPRKKLKIAFLSEVSLHHKPTFINCKPLFLCVRTVWKMMP